MPRASTPARVAKGAWAPAYLRLEAKPHRLVWKRAPCRGHCCLLQVKAVRRQLAREVDVFATPLRRVRRVPAPPPHQWRRRRLRGPQAVELELARLASLRAGGARSQSQYPALRVLNPAASSQSSGPRPRCCHSQPHGAVRCRRDVPAACFRSSSARHSCAGHSPASAPTHPSTAERRRRTRQEPPPPPSTAAPATPAGSSGAVTVAPRPAAHRGARSPPRCGVGYAPKPPPARMEHVRHARPATHRCCTATSSAAHASESCRRRTARISTSLRFWSCAWPYLAEPSTYAGTDVASSTPRFDGSSREPTESPLSITHTHCTPVAWFVPQPTRQRLLESSAHTPVPHVPRVATPGPWTHATHPACAMALCLPFPPSVSSASTWTRPSWRRSSKPCSDAFTPTSSPRPPRYTPSAAQWRSPQLRPNPTVPLRRLSTLSVLADRSHPRRG